MGVTGIRSSISTDLKPIIGHIREVSDVPCAIGFGISNPEQAKAMASISDGAIVGSAIVKIVEKYGKEAAEDPASDVAEPAQPDEAQPEPQEDISQN